MSSSASDQRWEAFREHRKESEKQLKKSSKRAKNDASERDRDREDPGSRRDQMSASEARWSLPLELLAGEWLREGGGEAASKAYVVEKLLPTLVLGLEKLLTEVSDRGLEESEEMQYDFNPVNLLAQYLMRNNPGHSSLPETHPYCTTLRQVSEQLNQVLLAIPEATLTELKAASRVRVEERERGEARRQEERQRRAQLLRDVHAQWRLSEETVNALELQHALRVWPKHAAITESLFQTAEEAMDEQTFIKVVMEGMETAGREQFDEFAEHLRVCGEERGRRRGWEVWRIILKEAFDHCDPSKIGYLSTQNVCNVLTSYYDSAADPIKQTLLNPVQWPMTALMKTAKLVAENEASGAGTAAVETEPKDGKKQEGEGEGGEGEGDKDEKKKEEGEGGEGEGDKDGKKQEGEGGGGEGGGGEGDKDGKKQEGEGGGGEGDKDGKKQEGEGGEGEGDKDGKKQEGEGGEGKGDKDGKKQEGEGGGGEGEGNGRKQEGEDKEMVPAAGGAKQSEEVKADGKEESNGEKIEAGLQGDKKARLSIGEVEFESILELFLGPRAERSSVEALAVYMRDNYTDSAEERAQRQQEIQKQLSAEQWREELESVFAAWDVDRSGSVDVSELHLVAARWNPGTGPGSEEAREHVKEVLSRQGQEVTRLPHLLFYAHLHQLTLPLSPEHRHTFTQHLTSCLQQTEEEVSRGRRREEALGALRLAGEQSGLQLSSAMQATLSAIQQDGVEFGGGKQCSVSIALLEDNQLCYKASTEPEVIGKTLSRTDKQVSFQAVDSKRPVHVPDTEQHGGVAFLQPSHSTEQSHGSLVVVPLLSPAADRTVLGTISVDTLTQTLDSTSTSTNTSTTAFEEHEIHFYQGVAECLSELCQWMSGTVQRVREAQEQLAQLTTGAPHVMAASLYLVEPRAPSQEGWQFRLVPSDGIVDTSTAPILPSPQQLLTRHHVFRSVSSGVPVCSYCCGQHCLAWPISGCGSSGSKPRPLAVLELTTSPLAGMEPVKLQPLSAALQHITL